ncbi:dehydrogenase [Thalassobacillus devorans]|uniref:Dehydrogenase n=1 Tax=Thalassobacillus devorans TaxID=279813 RepID=A0ABQ1P0Y8_9BACI|nr:DUF1932 domain-containing protein [Thalassobacillus devorans]NIK28078.1 3-hydroxyisobutyrate dehydrogenase-like beta-hydroxyacid dehydrogenase [Thalassobacillus devorans]GGC89032.1 dehydrogenase [Thalassobacillus devorans]
MRIGFIGFGEVSYEMSKGFKEAGVKDICAFDPLYEDHSVQERAQQSGIRLFSIPEKVAEQELDVLITAVPAQHAYSAWEQISDYFQSETIYVDVSTAGASVKYDIYKKLMKENHYLVDGALMGPLPVHQHKVPIFASGNGTDKFIEIMKPYQMNIEKISDKTGDATNIKFIRSIYTKGLSMLLLEVIQLSNKLGLEDTIIESLGRTMDEKPFEEIMNRLITGSAIHSGRRLVEMENVISFVEENGEVPMMAKATKDKLEELTTFGLKEKFNNKTPDNWKLVVNELSKERGEINSGTFK